MIKKRKVKMAKNMTRAIIQSEDKLQYFFCDDPEWDTDYEKSKVTGVVKTGTEIGIHECIKSALYDDMTKYVDIIQKENELPDNELFIVTYFKYDGFGLEQLVDFGVTKQQIINNVIAQKYVEGANYFTTEQLQKVA